MRSHHGGLLAVALMVAMAGCARTPDGTDTTVSNEPAGTAGIALPIEYPVGEELPDLGDTPGPLAAIWLAPRVGGGAPQAVGLVAETGMFGTLPIDLPHDPQAPDLLTRVALSADGRRIAYPSPTGEPIVDDLVGELIVHDLVSGKKDSPLSEFETRTGYAWIDATRLLGHVAGGSDTDGWMWEPGTPPTLVNPYLVPYGGSDLSVAIQGGGPQDCWSPTLLNVQTHQENGGKGWAGSFDVPVLCDVLGITRSGILLAHWNSDRLPGDWNDPNDGNRTVVALEINGADPSFEDPALRRVVATAGAPPRVSFATELLREALDADGGGS